MKLCNKHCEPLCDFCANFKESDDVKEYYNDGLCTIKNIEVSRLDDCDDDFVCFRTIKQG